MGKHDILLDDQDLFKMFDGIDTDKNGLITLDGKITKIN